MPAPILRLPSLRSLRLGLPSLRLPSLALPSPGLPFLRLALAGLVCAAAALAAPHARACSPAQAACEIPGGQYHILLPTGRAPIGAVVYLHGHGGAGDVALRRRDRIGAFLDAGYAVIGPDGARWRGEGSPRSWNAMRAPGGRDDVKFVLDVVDDAARRFGFDRGAVMATGFSAGGMMVWLLACEAPEKFAAFAPVSGTFWRPVPTDCTGDPAIFHTHGTSDTVVPIEGRALANGRLLQGDVREVIAMTAAREGCAARPSATARLGATPESWETMEWAGCARGALVEALHPGGHDVPKGWATAALAFADSLRPAR